MISRWWCINFNWNWLINFMALRQGDGWKIITYMRLENMSLGQLKIRECQVTWGGLCNILASQQSSEQNFGHFHPPVYYFPGFLDFFLKDLPRYCLKTEKSMVSKVAQYLPEWPKKAGGRLTDGEKWQFFWGCDVAATAAHAPPSECVLYAPLVAWWWPGCTRAR